jgi:hypothetical protein
VQAAIRCVAADHALQRPSPQRRRETLRVVLAGAVVDVAHRRRDVGVAEYGLHVRERERLAASPPVKPGTSGRNIRRAPEGRLGPGTSSPVANHQNKTEAAHAKAGAADRAQSADRVERSTSPAPTSPIATAIPQKWGRPASDGPSVIITTAPIVPVVQAISVSRSAVRLAPSTKYSPPGHERCGEHELAPGSLAVDPTVRRTRLWPGSRFRAAGRTTSPRARGPRRAWRRRAVVHGLTLRRNSCGRTTCPGPGTNRAESIGSSAARIRPPCRVATKRYPSAVAFLYGARDAFAADSRSSRQPRHSAHLLDDFCAEVPRLAAAALEC